MKKMRLDIEELAVETFSVSDDENRMRGTVHGHVIISAAWSCDTWEVECGGTAYGEQTCNMLDSCDTNCAWGTTCFGGNGTC